MNKTIEFKKDCIMKTYISEITEINISHDYKVLDDTIEGVFIVDGLYKITKSSITTEEFNYKLPFTIAISSMIDKDSIKVDINDFTYSFEKDVLHLNMKLDMRYEEIIIDEIENVINDIDIEKEIEKDNTYIEDNNTNIVKDNIIENNTNNVLDNVFNTNDYAKYKVYIMRGEDTINSVCLKYNVNIDDIKEYNDIDNINVGDKIVIPINE